MKFLIFSLTLLISLNAFASPKTDANWASLIKANSLSSGNQAYCYTDKNQSVLGKNTDMKVRLASVSKLLTSLWAVDKLGMDYKYNTQLYIKGHSLHIKGSFDPFFGNEKMFFLLSQLNELGYEHFDSITFDKNLVLIPDILYEIDEYPSINSVTMSAVLKNYFNTKSWNNDTKDQYDELYSLAAEGRFKKNVHFTVDNVSMVEVNPFEKDSSAKMLTLSSPSLYKYLKQMNVKSNNSVAETVFHQLGKAPNFELYMKNQYNLSSDQIKFYSGSGLPTEINGTRYDNYATCKVVLNLLSKLKNTVEKQNKKLEDLVAVPGSDKGTFKNRIISLDYKNSFVAKTGTLVHTSALAGGMNTQSGFSFFGIFNLTSDISGAKIVQNGMVKSIMRELGGPKAFDYKVEGFHPYITDALKSLDNELGDEFDAEFENFSTIESNLY